MGVQIKGLDRLNSKLKRIPKTLENATWDATFEITEEVQSRATAKLQSSIKHGSGELAGSLKNEVLVNKNGHVVGRVWSDDPNLLFRELGTGQVGENSPKDLPEGINPVYTQSPWFIPADAVDVDLEAVYGMVKINIQGKDYYRTNGQPARPSLYPALKEGVENYEEVYKKYVKQGLREELK